MLEIHNSLNLFMQTLNVNEVCWVRVNSRNLGLTQTWENNTKSPCAKQKWSMTPLFWVDLNGMKMAWYSACLLLLFLFRTNGKKGHLDKNNFCHYYGNFFRNWYSEKLLDHSYVQSPFSTNTRHFNNSILKDTLSSLFYGHRSTCVLNLSSWLW